MNCILLLNLLLSVKDENGRKVQTHPSCDIRNTKETVCRAGFFGHCLDDYGCHIWNEACCAGTGVPDETLFDHRRSTAGFYLRRGDEMIDYDRPSETFSFGETKI